MKRKLNRNEKLDNDICALLRCSHCHWGDCAHAQLILVFVDVVVFRRSDRTKKIWLEKFFFLFCGLCAPTLLLPVSCRQHSRFVPGLVLLNYCSFGHRSFIADTQSSYSTTTLAPTTTSTTMTMSTETVAVCTSFSMNTHIPTHPTHTLRCHRNDVKICTDKSLLLWCT